MSARGAIHQFVPVLAARDAIGGHVFGAQALLREAGWESEIYADEIRPEVVGRGHQRSTYRSGPSGRTWMLYHCSTGSTMGPDLVERHEPLLIDYHNITPANLFEKWEPWVGGQMALARDQLAHIAPHAVAGLADSSFNANELHSFGCHRTEVAPILLDLVEFDAAPDAATLERLRARKSAGGLDWLFVGRIAPNKAQHDLILALAAFRATVDPAARLWLVGGSSSHLYLTRLGELIDALDLRGAVELVGQTSDAQLRAYYAAADAFVCLSEHEGFCVPVVEAMHLGVPVIAFHAGAVPETLGEGGLLISDKRPLDVSEAVARVVLDPARRAAFVEAGRRRALDFAFERTSRRFLDAIDAVTSA